MDLGNKNLILKRILGQGTFGIVYLCNCYENDLKKEVCVKRICVRNGEIDIKMIFDEIHIISQLKHPNIVQFISSYVHKGSVNIVMEYVAGGTLRNVIEQANQLTLNHLTRYFCDMLMGLEYLHIRHVLHCDLKPDNLLLTLEGGIKIADFGIAAVYCPKDVKKMKFFGTPLYVAPEVLYGEGCDFKSDIWSLGCVLYELCLGIHPFAKAKTMQDLFQLIRQTLNFESIKYCYNGTWSNFCKCMLVYETEKRISLPDLISLDANLTINYYKKYFDYNY